MTDPISNYGRRVQSDGALRDALAKADRKSSGTAPSTETAPRPKASLGQDQVSLSNVAQRAMAQPDFDRAKVDAIKAAIQNGQYPINARKIAENFAAIEQMIGQ
jgi:negative regulator of flagellin synthesis FlgM